LRIDALANFQMRKSVDGIDGLEAKLVAGQRQDELLMDALEKKEQFAKLLQKWPLYASAQEIFAYLLAKAEYEFNHFIHPQITTLPRISVDGHSYFSASSRVILKSSFFLGFLSAAMKDSQFRHPRFVMIDTIEDKGMEPERSHNFQNLILDASLKSQVEHQIIFATAMIAPDLDDEQFLIGKFSTRDDPTINIR
jgi:hypothetical protein